MSFLRLLGLVAIPKCVKQFAPPVAAWHFLLVTLLEFLAALGAKIWASHVDDGINVIAAAQATARV
jgi:hypothetical protein